jgi:hypothetical protein
MKLLFCPSQYYEIMVWPLTVHLHYSLSIYASYVTVVDDPNEVSTCQSIH